MVFQRQVDEIYGVSDFTVVGLTESGTDTIFTPEALNWILHLTKRVEQLPGVRGDQVRSLATVPVASANGQSLRFSPPLSTEVVSTEQAQTIRASVERNTLFRGTLVSVYGHSAAIYAPMEPGTQREEVFHEIERLATEEAGILSTKDHQLTTYVLGPAAAESMLGQHILSDLAAILPASMVLVGLLLWLWFRQKAIVLIGLGEVAAMEIWSIGLMCAFRKPISLVTVVMPVVLAVFCVADTIHIAQRFNEKCGLMRQSSRRRCMDAALAEVVRPVVFASLTAFAGFLSFVFSPIPPVRDLGIFTAFGIACDLGVSLFVIPPLLLASRFGGHENEWAAYRAVEKLLGKVTRIAANQAMAVIFGFVLATSLLGAGVALVKVQDSWIDNFRRQNKLVGANDWFNREFYGSDVLNVLIDSGSEGGAFDPDFLTRVGHLEVELGMGSGGGGAVGLVDEIKSAARALHLPETTPPPKEEAKQWYLRYKEARAGLGADPFLDPRGAEVNIWVFVNHASYAKTAGLINFIQRRIGPDLPIRYAGDAYRGFRLVDSITKNLRTSLLASLAMTFFLVVLMLRSFKLAFLAILPVSLAVLWNFGLMGWIGVPLGVATSTFSAIALGLGVDFSLHWLARFRLAREQSKDLAGTNLRGDQGAGMTSVQPRPSHDTAITSREVVVSAPSNDSEALRITGARTGGAILLNAAILIAGFGIMLLSAVPPNQRLGLLMCANLVASAAASLLLLPALVSGLRGENPRLNQELGALSSETAPDPAPTQS